MLTDVVVYANSRILAIAVALSHVIKHWFHMLFIRGKIHSWISQATPHGSYVGHRYVKCQTNTYTNISRWRLFLVYKSSQKASTHSKMPVAPVDQDGTIWYYEDSGAPSTSSPYVTLVIVHGTAFHGGVYSSIALRSDTDSRRII